ncbi:Response regulator rcp1 [Burkholderiales bacterium]|nr:MAG: response regulator [Burkholderiales bacterium]CAG0948590.1 Response regulator rcp1 [Burkholderiales bacterium]
MAGKTLMLVEDNVDDIELFKLALTLSNLDSDIMVARDGPDALAMLIGKEYGPLPDVILLDLKLPRLNGLDVLRAIKGNPRTRAIPVVILTTSGERSDLETAYEIGCNSYLRKPVDFSQFNDMVRDVHRYWLNLNTAPPTPGELT